MRQQFFSDLHELMTKDERVNFICADLGYFFSDNIFKYFPERAYNVGAAEQCMLGVGIGMALQGKIPFCYSITPFLLYRPFEAIRTYINHEQIPVIMIGSGRDKDYKHDGWSHDGSDDKQFMKLFENIKSYWPETKEEIPDLLNKVLESKKPAYINLTR